MTNKSVAKNLAGLIVLRFCSSPETAVRADTLRLLLLLVPVCEPEPDLDRLPLPARSYAAVQVLDGLQLDSIKPFNREFPFSATSCSLFHTHYTSCNMTVRHGLMQQGLQSMFSSHEMLKHLSNQHFADRPTLKDWQSAHVTTSSLSMLLNSNAVETATLCVLYMFISAGTLKRMSPCLCFSCYKFG